MKKQRLLSLLLSCILLTGCSYRVQSSAKKPASTPALPSSQPGSSGSVSTEEPGLSTEELSHRVLVSYRLEEKHYTHPQSGALLLDYSCTTPLVTLPDLPNAQMSIQSILDALTEAFRTGGDTGSGWEEMLQMAEEDYDAKASESASPFVSFVPYALQRQVRVARADAAVISFLFEGYINLGGAHGNGGTSGLVFDTTSGQQLSFSDLAEDADALRELCMQEIRTQAEARREELYESYEQYLPSLLEDGSWYFTEKGLVFAANPYLLAPYAAGTIEFFVSYKKLSGTLHPRYLRPTRAVVQGGMNANWPSELDIARREPLQTLRLAELSPFCLWAENTVYNVRLSTVAYRDYLGSFEAQQELLFASRMDDGEYWSISADIPDGIPNLQLSWQLPDGTVQCCLVSMSGKDGSLILTDPSTMEMLQPGELRPSQTEFGFLWDLNGDGVAEQLCWAESGSGQTLLVTREGKESRAETPYSACPRCFVADVDGDGYFEILLSGVDSQGNSLICAWRYQSALAPVSFSVDGRELTRLEGSILGVDASELILSGTVDILGSYTGSCVFSGGSGGSLSPVGKWDLSGNEKYITASSDLSFTDEYGGSGRLCAGTRLRVISYDGTQVGFETDSRLRGFLTVVHKSDGSISVDGKSVSAAFDGVK